MRFLIDQDVDAAVARMLRRHNHDAWTADAVGLAAAADDDLSVWASAHQASVVSTDVEFGLWVPEIVPSACERGFCSRDWSWREQQQDSPGLRHDQLA